MPRARPEDEELQHQKAIAIKLHLQGQGASAIARKLGVSRFTINRWVREMDPARQVQSPATYQRNVGELSELVYDTIVETLRSIRARAVETGRPEWITTQDASQLAALDTAQWDRVIRVLSAFRPAVEPAMDEEGEAAADGGGDVYDQQPGVHRNGAVDPTS